MLLQRSCMSVQKQRTSPLPTAKIATFFSTFAKNLKTEPAMKILIDNGHGIETPGKRSPDGRLREYRYTREIAAAVVSGLQQRGLEAIRLAQRKSPQGQRLRTRQHPHLHSLQRCRERKRMASAARLGGIYNHRRDQCRSAGQ